MLDRVTDEYGVELELGAVLGQPGGQGEVRRVTGQPTLAVKVLRQPPKPSLESIRRLPLHGISIAAPTRLLRDRWGYVMELAGEMSPLEDLAPRPGPRGFSRRHDLDWYRATGGLVRRLRILARTADTMARLQGLSLVYVDLNPGNVMISDSPLLDEVLLIDADNLALTSVVGAGVHTPGFRVPERTRGTSGPSTLSDAYAFAILAFALLTMKYPFEGAAALELDGDEAVEQADRGELAFIDDPTDRSNAADGGLPRTLALSPVLSDLAATTFGPGRLDPTRRPSMAAWARALWRAADNAVTCSCGWSYYRTLPACPLCDLEGPPLLGVTVRRTTDGARAETQTVVPEGTKRDISERTVLGTSSEDAVVEFRVSAKEIVVTPGRRARVELVAGKPGRKISGPGLVLKLEPGGGARLRVDAEEATPRYLDLHWVGGR